jgi:hypothetical protein
MADPTSPEGTYDDEIDLRLIFAVLWRQRKLIILGTLGATLLAIGISFLIPKVYRSEGFFQLGNPSYEFIEDDDKLKSEKPKPIGISIPIYKSSSSQFFNSNRLYIKAGQDKSFNEEDLTKIKDDLKSTADIAKWIKPVYSFAKEDAREFTQLPKDELNSVLGLNVSFEAYSPEKAAAHVSFLGNYARDCLMHFTLYNYIMDGFNDTTAATSKMENQIIEAQFQLQQNSKKGKILKPFSQITPIRQKWKPARWYLFKRAGACEVTAFPVKAILAFPWEMTLRGRPFLLCCVCTLLMIPFSWVDHG